MQPQQHQPARIEGSPAYAPKLAAYYQHSEPVPGPPMGQQHQAGLPLSYLQQRHQPLTLSKAMTQSTSMLTSDSCLVGGMSSDSELSAGSRSSRAHARPHSSQSRVYHAHPAPRQQSTSTVSYMAAGGSSLELTYATTGQPGRRHQQQQPPSPQHQHQQRPSRQPTSAIATRQLPSRPFKHSMSVDQQSYQQQPHYHQPAQLTGGPPGHYAGPTATPMRHSGYQQQQSWSAGPQNQNQILQEPTGSCQQQENRFRHDLDYLEKRTNAISLSAGPGLNHHHPASVTDSPPHHGTPAQQVAPVQRHSALTYPARLGLSADQLPQSLQYQLANEQQQEPVDWLPPAGRAGAPFKQAMSIDQHQPSQYPIMQAHRQTTANANYYPRPLANLRHQDPELAIRLEQQQKSPYISKNNHYHHTSQQQLYTATSDILPAVSYLTGQQHQSSSEQQQQAYAVQQRLQESAHYSGPGPNLKPSGGQVSRERALQQQPLPHQLSHQLRSAVKRVGPQLGSSTSALNELGHTPVELSGGGLVSAKSLLVSSPADAPTKRPLQRATSPGPSLGLGGGVSDSPAPGTSVSARQADRQHYLAREAGQQALASSESTRSESSTGLQGSNEAHEANNSSTLTKKSNSATQLSMSGTKKRLGFRKKQVTSFSVHRSEEVGGPPDGARNLVKQGSSVSEGESSLSGDSSSRSWSNSNFKQQISDEVASMSFIEGLGKGQMISRQGLASPYLGDIQLSLSDRRGNLEVEVIRARNLQAKVNKILPLTYVKLYLVKNRKCLAKAKTALCNKRTLDPLFQQQLTFHEDYHGSILQSIVWGNFGKMDKKNFMGIAQISIDDLDLSDTVLSWYKLFLPSSLQTMPSKSLRHTLLSNSTESFTTNTHTNTNS